MATIEADAVKAVITLAARFGYGNLIAHLQTAWAKSLMDAYGFDEATARGAAGPGYPFGWTFPDGAAEAQGAGDGSGEAQPGRGAKILGGGAT